MRKKRIARRRKIGSRLAATMFAGRHADATSKAANQLLKGVPHDEKLFLRRPFSASLHDIKSDKRVCGNVEGVVGFSTSCPTVRLWQNFLRSA